MLQFIFFRTAILQKFFDKRFWHTVISHVVPYSSRWLPKPWWGQYMYLLSSLITRIVLKESLMEGIQEKNFFSAPYVDCSFSTVFLVFLQNKQGLWGNYIFCYFSRIAALKMKTSKWVSKMTSVIRRKMSYIWQQRTNKVNFTYPHAILT